MKYWTKHGMMGMMGKYSFFSESEKFFFKNRKNIICFDTNLKFKNFKTSYSYIREKDFLKIFKKDIKSKYFLIQTISKFDKNFFNLEGKKFKEIRETRNKFNKIIKIKKDADIKEILNLIDCWDVNRGEKYGWQKHSGYDRNFFNRFFRQEKSNLQSLFFYIDGNLVGYSIISLLKENDNIYNYIIRKNDTTYRNLCLYIDYKSFEFLFQNEKEFFINWGASSGSLLKYKEKFPIYEQEKLYFFKLKEQI